VAELSLAMRGKAQPRGKDLGALAKRQHGVVSIRQLRQLLACGPRALLSHYSAAWPWNLTPTQPVPIHVTSPVQNFNVAGMEGGCQRRGRRSDRLVSGGAAGSGWR
jgi:hypothetical protein